MKVRPIHENLDTSFVNVSSLVRYLRRRQFVGKICIELSGYEADIYLGELNELRACEHDRIAGRFAEGEEALQRILIRSREPGGIVNVYQAVTEKEIAAEKTESKKAIEPEISSVENGSLPKPPQLQVPTPQLQVLSSQIPKSAQLQIPPQQLQVPSPQIPKPQQVHDIKPASLQFAALKEEPKNLPPEKPVVEAAPKPKPKISLPDFPFELSNKVENKARTASLSPNDWQTLLKLTGELLETIKQALAEANLDFDAAFRKVRAEISPDYPFLSPTTEIFEYKEGQIRMNEQVSANLFTISIIESLRRILEKLGTNPKFSGVYRHTTQKILALIRQRKPLYDKFSITKPLERVLGV